MLIIFNVYVNVQELRNVHLTLNYDVAPKKQKNQPSFKHKTTPE